MRVWQLQEAKAKLTQLIKNAELEPQIISKYGVRNTIVMSKKKYEDLLMSKENIVHFLQNSPLYEIDLEMERDHSLHRIIEL